VEKADDLVVLVAVARDIVCRECGAAVEPGDLMTMEGGRPLCLACADMDHLEFLPSGDVALTRRAKKHSPLSAVVLRFNRSRKRYERQGLLVTPDALARAEDECIADAGERATRRQAAAAARGVADQQFAGTSTSSTIPCSCRGSNAVPPANAFDRACRKSSTPGVGREQVRACRLRTSSTPGIPRRFRANPGLQLTGTEPPAPGLRASVDAADRFPGPV
jgi:hypothetical protein